jgi:hypothetical protein
MNLCYLLVHKQQVEEDIERLEELQEAAEYNTSRHPEKRSYLSFTDRYSVKTA